MSDHAGHARPMPVAGPVAAGTVALVCLAALTGLMLAGSRFSLPSWPYLSSILSFTLLQAGLSTLISLAGGAALALALARRGAFRGRGAVLALLNVASVLPAIVAVFGIVAAFGRSGPAGTALAALGLDPGWLYGLPGILIAHAFFNIPLAARTFLHALERVPAEHWRLAAQLGMGPSAILRLLDWPVLRREMPGLAAVIFLVCFTSFAVVLALGGGPGSATLEVAIFEALRFDVDFGRAAGLALLQVSICAGLAGLILLRPPALAEGTGTMPRILSRADARAPGLRIADGIVLVAVLIFIGLPLSGVLRDGLQSLSSLADPEIGRALAMSLVIGLGAACLACLIAMALANWRRRGDRGAALASSMAGLVSLTVPPFALVAGLFVLLRPYSGSAWLAPGLVVVVNALMALPWTLRQIEGPMLSAQLRHGRLCASLGIAGLDRLRLVDWPLLRRPFTIAFATAFCLSLGDLGVAAFFGSGEFVTLPLVVLQRLGAYRMAEAGAAALLLAGLILCVYLVAERLAGPQAGPMTAED